MASGGANAQPIPVGPGAVGCSNPGAPEQRRAGTACQDCCETPPRGSIAAPLAVPGQLDTLPRMTSITIPGGLLVAIEGIDGAGKSTLARGLTERLIAAGVAVSTSKEPTNGHWGMRLRQSALSGRLSPEEEVKYLLADRRDHVEHFIEPALRRGEVVILDRYFPSMVAYQGAAGVPVDQLSAANAFAPRPHLMLLLDVEPSTGLERIRARGDRPNHFENEENLSLCRQIFLEMTERSKFVINATKSEADVLEDSYVLVIRQFAQNLGTASVENVEKLGALMSGHLA